MSNVIDFFKYKAKRDFDRAYNNVYFLDTCKEETIQWLTDFWRDNDQVDLNTLLDEQITTYSIDSSLTEKEKLKADMRSTISFLNSGYESSKHHNDANSDKEPLE